MNPESNESKLLKDWINTTSEERNDLELDTSGTSSM